jgi:AraC family transcriptional regulator of adaptative response/methylated-DNA-[protein]-cysteine methyltransferase
MSARHYQTVQVVIEHIVANRLHAQPLDEIAAALGMSPGRLQKVFVAWAGISPKQFGRYLSLQYSKELLAGKSGTLEASAKAGLSGTSRLHDLFVDIEAMTPGEFKAQGEGLSIRYSIFDTRFGDCLVASTDRGICAVLFGDSKDDVVADLHSRFPKAKIVRKADASHAAVRDYFAGIAPSSKIKLHLSGTNFQVKVWEALLSIPDGHISTYGEVARRMGDPKLSRAVGMAIGDNPIGYIIPCHRVLKSTGQISGYRWGVGRKRAMLGYEALRKAGE